MRNCRTMESFYRREMETMTVPMHLHENVPIHKSHTLMLAYKAGNYPRIFEAYNYRRNQQDWQIVVKDIDRGFCNNTDKLIVIPEWAFKHRDTEFCIYYLAHELAHIETDTDREPHGPQWRTKFMFLCPKRLVKYDLNYRLGDTQHANI